jgi:salicylate hydroxylase
VEEALKRYEAARRDRTARMVLGSAENARRFHNPELAEPAGAQNYVNREWAEERVRERYDWLFRYQVDTVPL